MDNQGYPQKFGAATPLSETWTVYVPLTISLIIEKLQYFLKIYFLST